MAKHKPTLIIILATSLALFSATVQADLWGEIEADAAKKVGQYIQRIMDGDHKAAQELSDYIASEPEFTDGAKLAAGQWKDACHEAVRQELDARQEASKLTPEQIRNLALVYTRGGVNRHIQDAIYDNTALTIKSLVKKAVAGDAQAIEIVGQGYVMDFTADVTNRHEPHLFLRAVEEWYKNAQETKDFTVEHLAAILVAVVKQADSRYILAFLQETEHASERNVELREQEFYKKTRGLLAALEKGNPGLMADTLTQFFSGLTSGHKLEAIVAIGDHCREAKRSELLHGLTGIVTSLPADQLNAHDKRDALAKIGGQEGARGLLTMLLDVTNYDRENRRMAYIELQKIEGELDYSELELELDDAKKRIAALEDSVGRHEERLGQARLLDLMAQKTGKRTLTELRGLYLDHMPGAMLPGVEAEIGRYAEAHPRQRAQVEKIILQKISNIESNGETAHAELVEKLADYSGKQGREKLREIALNPAYESESVDANVHDNARARAVTKVLENNTPDDQKTIEAIIDSPDLRGKFALAAILVAASSENAEVKDSAKRLIREKVLQIDDPKILKALISNEFLSPATIKKLAAARERGERSTIDLRLTDNKSGETGELVEGVAYDFRTTEVRTREARLAAARAGGTAAEDAAETRLHELRGEWEAKIEKALGPEGDKDNRFAATYRDLKQLAQSNADQQEARAALDSLLDVKSRTSDPELRVRATSLVIGMARAQPNLAEATLVQVDAVQEILGTAASATEADAVHELAVKTSIDLAKEGFVRTETVLGIRSEIADLGEQRLQGMRDILLEAREAEAKRPRAAETEMMANFGFREVGSEDSKKTEPTRPGGRKPPARKTPKTGGKTAGKKAKK